MLKTKKTLVIILSVLLVLSSSLLLVNASGNNKMPKDYKDWDGKIKNVIMLIPDGTSVDSITLARLYKGGEGLALDEIASGTVKTYWAEGPITDSAPAGTALSTGAKSSSGSIGLQAKKTSMPGLAEILQEDSQKPLCTVLEAAKLKGMSTGLVATSNIQHATPASFSAHYFNRDAYDMIGEQQVYNGLDVVLAGGSKYLSAEKRKDKEDLNTVIRNKGYNYVSNKHEMEYVKNGKLWGMFGEDALSYDFDRDPDIEPSLSEMTKKAIELLSQNKYGFFLMVEGSKIDWASHANDPIGIISDVLAFDESVKVALDFAKSNKETVVLACSDHGNGGISIGDVSLKNYSTAGLNEIMEPLKKAKLTGEGLEKKINGEKTNIAEVMSEYYGIVDLSEEEIQKIKDAEPGKLNQVVGKMISKRAHIGWTTNGHTGEDVILYCYHPESRYRLTGTVENTDVAKYVELVLGLNLENNTNTLYKPARKVFEAKGANVNWNIEDQENPVIEVSKGNKVLKMPINKNVVYVDGKEIILKGLVVYNGIKTYVPEDAVSLID